MLDPLKAIRSESDRIAEIAGRSGVDLDARVPSCPQWSLRDLVVHLGGVQGFWAENVRAGDVSAPHGDDLVDPPPDGELAGWMRANTDDLISALAKADEAAPCWTWWGEPATAGAVARHQVQEAAVHRWDAEAAVGAPGPLDPDVAHDGVSEFLDVMFNPGRETLRGTELPRLPAVTLAASDTGGRWKVGTASDKRVTVSATASDLVLLLYGRLPTSAVAVDGDAAAVDTLLESLNTE